MLDEEELGVYWRSAGRDLAGSFMERDCCLVDDLMCKIVKYGGLIKSYTNQPYKDSTKSSLDMLLFAKKNLVEINTHVYKSVYPTQQPDRLCQSRIPMLSRRF